MSMNRQSLRSAAEKNVVAALGCSVMALAVGVFFTPNLAAADTCYVSNGSSIQDAIDTTSCTTIDVAPGTYHENLTIDHTVALYGANAGINAGIDSRNEISRGEESVIIGNPAITINATDVIVDGFTIKGKPAIDKPAYGITITSGSIDAIIRNSIFTGISSEGHTLDCNFTNRNTLTAQAVTLSGGPDHVVMVHNLMKNITSCGSAKAIAIGDSGATDPSVGVSIIGNLMTNITSTNYGAYGVQVNNGSSEGNSDLLIENNHIIGLSGTGHDSTAPKTWKVNGATGWVHAIGLEANTPNAIVTGNTIANLLASKPDDAVAVWFESEESSDSLSNSRVHQNNFFFTGNPAVFGIKVAAPDGASVAGECNYWGNASGPSDLGPGSGARVSMGVDFSPWLKHAAPSACPPPGRQD